MNALICACDAHGGGSNTLTSPPQRDGIFTLRPKRSQRESSPCSNTGFVILLAVLITASTALYAGSEAGRVTGSVTDPSEGTVAAAQVRLLSSATGTARETATDENGHYRFDPVPAGLYEVAVSAPHFAAVTRKNVTVRAGEETPVPFRLSITEVKTVVSVTESEILAGQEVVSPTVARSGDTASLLAGTPGLSLYGNGGVSSLPAIHGMEDDRVRILVDGVDLISACANHMNPPLSYIDPTNVGSIKVLAGITPVSAGGDSIGGTIAVDSRAPEFAGAGKRTLLGGEAGTFYRSNGDTFGSHLNFSIASETLSLRYAGSVSRSGDYSSAANFEAPGLAAVDKGSQGLRCLRTNHWHPALHFGNSQRLKRERRWFRSGLQWKSVPLEHAQIQARRWRSECETPEGRLLRLGRSYRRIRWWLRGHPPALVRRSLLRSSRCLRSPRPPSSSWHPPAVR